MFNNQRDDGPAGLEAALVLPSGVARGKRLRPDERRRSGGDYRVAMEGAGLAVETFDFTRGYPHPHFALRGRKAAYG